jgi:hypothetical protein
MDEYFFSPSRMPKMSEMTEAVDFLVSFCLNKVRKISFSSLLASVFGAIGGLPFGVDRGRLAEFEPLTRLVDGAVECLVEWFDEVRVQGAAVAAR